MKILAWFATTVVIPLILVELVELAPLLARWIVKFGARLIMNRTLADRYKEEWLADIDDRPGKLTKLVSAFGLVVLVVPKINYLLFDLLWQRKVGAPVAIAVNLRILRTWYSVDPFTRRGAPTPENRQWALEFNRVLAATCRWVRDGNTEQCRHALEELSFLVDNPLPLTPASSLATRHGKRALKDLAEALERRDARLDRAQDHHVSVRNAT